MGFGGFRVQRHVSRVLLRVGLGLLEGFIMRSVFTPSL